MPGGDVTDWGDNPKTGGGVLSNAPRSGRVPKAPRAEPKETPQAGTPVGDDLTSQDLDKPEAEDARKPE